MAYVKELGESHFGVQRFGIMVTIQGSVRKSATIYAKDIEEAKSIASDIETELESEKIRILRKKALDGDEVERLSEFFSRKCKKYNTL